MKEITYAQAVCEALDEEMERDDMVMMIGEDVGFIGGNFKTSVGLLEKYGDLRMKDSPISEQGIVGMGVGMALTGMRPVVELMFSDFLLELAGGRPGLVSDDETFKLTHACLLAQKAADTGTTIYF